MNLFFFANRTIIQRTVLLGRHGTQCFKYYQVVVTDVQRGYVKDVATGGRLKYATVRYVTVRYVTVRSVTVRYYDLSSYNTECVPDTFDQEMPPINVSTADFISQVI